VDLHLFREPFGLPLSAAVLEVADQFLLLVSTEMTGQPAARYRALTLLMYRNWASRSGLWCPSRVLAFAWRL
jgi:hypothetical protein